MPALDEDELGTAVQRALEPLLVSGDRQARVVGGEHKSDESLGSARERRLDRLGDPRPPVLHARVDRQPELALEPGALSFGYFVKRGAAADAAVALAEPVDRLLRDGLPLAEV